MSKLVVLSLPDCAPCKALLKRLNSLGVSYQYVDLEQNPEMADDHYVTSVPVLLFANGNRYDGAPGMEKLVQLLAENE